VDRELWRLFLGVWPDAPVRDAVVAQAGRWQWPSGVRFTRPERLHLTLHFIGDVDHARVPDLAKALDVPSRPWQLHFDAAEVWPGGIAVLEASRVAPALSALHLSLGEALRGQALPVDSRRFRPHVTIARHAHGSEAPAGNPPVDWASRGGYALVRSLPAGRGYEEIQRFG
jgi:2'-5' RNA ligase